MRPSIIFLVAVGFNIGFGNYAQAISKKPTHPTVSSMRSPVKSTPLLTKEECEGLGGTATDEPKCKTTGSTCETVDQHGVIHTSCINQKSEN
jgi:hypothetical protein